MKSGRFDFAIIIPVLFLIALSLSLILSVNPSLFFPQLLFFLGGFLVFLLLSLVDSASLFRSFASPLYLLLLFFLVSSFFAPEIRGAYRWIDVLGLQFQPSELAKPFFIVCFAQFILFFSPQKFKFFFLNLFLVILPIFLIFKQPDLGNAILYSGTWLVMLLAGGSKPRFISYFLIFILLISPFLWSFLRDYQRLRILSFLSPARYSQTASYHSIQAKISVGSGEVLGRGLGQGTQSHLKFLPEYYTDFIFASLCEELGFLGGFLILCCYFFLLLGILRVGTETKDPFSYLFSIGIFTQLLLQVFINVGMNLGLVPITGITLPLVSYGGSSIVSTLTALGIVSSLRKKSKPEIFVLG